MEIYSETGYLIIMDPNYLQLGKSEEINKIDFIKKPKQAAIILEKILFPDGGNGKIGLIQLSDGPGKYSFDTSRVSYWDVDEKGKKGKTIFGVELGSFIIFDINLIREIKNRFDQYDFKKTGEKDYFAKMNQQLNKRHHVILWNQSQVGIGDGWHQVKWAAFTKC